MIKFLALGAALAVPVFGAAPTNAWPPFEEVYGLVRSNLTGIDAATLDRLAVRGLLGELKSQIELVSSDPPSPAKAAASESGLLKTQIYDASYACFRVPAVTAALAEQLKGTLSKLNATNKLKGLILDLRFASGTDTAAAAATADLFLAEEKPLLQTGTETIRAKAKTDAVTLPVAVLVNQETSGAAEVLAAIMRENEIGLLIGAPTSGKTGTYKTFPLSSGQTLRVATSAIKLGDGRELSPQGLTPDILVELSPEAEKAYWDDPFKVRDSGSRSGRTNSPDNLALAGPRRLNEAELVRQRREGAPSDVDPFARSRGFSEPRPVVADPVLARALDLLKGLSLVQESRQ